MKMALLQSQIPGSKKLMSFRILLTVTFYMMTNLALGGEDSVILAKYPKLSEKPFGKGIFAHVRRGGKTRASRAQINLWANHPYIAGTQLSYSWAELEPRQGDYRWELIEADMDPWAQAGKKCWIEVSTANKRAKGKRPSSTPKWVFEHGVPRVGNSTTATYPVFWNPKYLELWESFIHAFAKKFDGDPRIEFISTGGYSSGHEPNLSSRDNRVLLHAWETAGFDGFDPRGVYLNKAIKPILAIYRDAFRSTPIAQTIHAKTRFDHAMMGYAASLKFILISNGFSVKANATTRRAWRERHERLKTKVGYAEWGPAGRETDLSKRHEKKRAKLAKKQGLKPPKRQKKKHRDRSSTASLMDVYRAGIGSDDHPSLAPHSRLSYLPLGKQIPAVETKTEWDKALKWGWEHLTK